MTGDLLKINRRHGIISDKQQGYFLTLTGDIGLKTVSEGYFSGEDTGFRKRGGGATFARMRVTLLPLFEVLGSPKGRGGGGGEGPEPRPPPPPGYTPVSY